MRLRARGVMAPALLALFACRDAGAGGGGLAGLRTAIDSSGDTVVARTDGEVPASAVRRLVEELRIEPAESDTTLFTEVFEADVDRSGRIWVYDTPSNSIFLFDSSGRLVRRVGRQGAGPGEFRQTSGMTPLGDTGFAVWDPGNGRISLFDSTGAFRSSWPSPGGFFTQDGLIADRSGRLYLRRPVAAPPPGEFMGPIGLVRLGADGGFADSLLPLDLGVERVEYRAQRVTGKDSRSSSSTGAAYGARLHWVWHPDGYFVAGHGGRFEILLARSDAKPLLIRRSASPIRVPPEERNEERERITYNMRRTDPNWSWSGPALPETKAPLMGLVVTRDLRIWARVAAPSERIPDQELAPPRQPGAPVNHFRTPIVFEVFGPEGRFMGRIPLPARSRLIEADGDRVWILERNADDLPAVVRYRIEPPLR